MCGFAGAFSWNHETPGLAPLERSLDVLAPRGPDGNGVWTRGPVAFGHRRLEIIDLSVQASQPMVDAESGLSLVYNGAIYNYPELRKELIQAGDRFFSTGDTEVILKGLRRFGPSFVERLNGMFAFVAYDWRDGSLLLARDRLGIKPLYVQHLPRGVHFASSLPALLARGDVDTQLDPVALHHYFTFHSVVPPPRTLLRGIQKLPPATIRHISADGRVSDRRYWTLTYPDKDDEGAEEDWRDRLTEELDRAVERRLVADVPVGVLLSGGLDSSLIVGLLARHGQAGLSTFSIGFEDAGGERGNEFEYSDIVAKHFGTDHHQIRVPTRDVLPNLRSCVRAMSEPMVSHDNIGFFLLSREVSRHVKVVQSGQGADEVFAGYHWYPPMLTANDAFETYRSHFFDRDHAEFERLIHPDYLGADESTRFVSDHFAAAGAPFPAQKALRLDTTVMLVDDPVKRVDNMTMAWGLEARVPFLDHELVEFAAHIPSSLKVKGDGKYILKEAARDIIPAAVIDRPKGYFPVPALKYISGPYLDFVKDALHAPDAKKRRLFRPEYIDQLLSEPSAHITPLRGSKLWQVALLEIWLQENGL
ncbi:MAG: N-acetylglutaminylglutamine amidotransferase [Myxococcota bacterium]